jgi:hypothetical protein
MSFTTYDASAPIFVNALTNMRNWLDKAESWASAAKPEAELLAARLTPDMHPLPRQYQMASDAAKGAIARLAGLVLPPMPDTEASFTELRERCDKTIAFINSVDPATIAAGATRDVVLKFGNGMGYRFKGADFLTGFAIPNFMFHATTAYAILRSAGVPLGKMDFLAHLGAPETNIED